MSTKSESSIFRHLGVSALSAGIAESTTLPLDTAKVRLQLMNHSAEGAGPRPGPLQTVSRIYKKEGFSALFKGLEAGLHRQLVFTGLRLGCYSHILHAVSDGEDRESASMGARITSALGTSALGITLANPADVIKVRTQARVSGPQAPASTSTPATPRAGTATRGVSPGVAASAAASHAGPGMARRMVASATARAASDAEESRLYRGSALRLYGHIIRHEGFLGGLYAGYTPNLIRNSIISASELVAYDVTKGAVKRHTPLDEGPLVHLLSGLSAGLVATVLGSPMDVVATRIMSAPRGSGGASPGLLQTCAEIVRTEGPLAFYQGFVPNFARIGAFNVVLWMSYEQLAALAGM